MERTRGQPFEEPLLSLVNSLEKLSEAELRRKVKARLADEEQTRLSELLAKNRATTLTPEENAEIEALLDRVEAVATEKAVAAWILMQSQTPSP